MSKKTILHRDGTVTYWSVYRQVRIPRAAHVPAKELAAMNSDERDKVRRHLSGADKPVGPGRPLLSGEPRKPWAAKLPVSVIDTIRLASEQEGSSQSEIVSVAVAEKYNQNN